MPDSGAGVHTQIYGLTTVADALAVDRLGPDHMGVVVDEGVDTWDSVDPDTAVAIASSIDHARVVALSLSTDPERILATHDLLAPAILHLARAHRMPADTLRSIGERIGATELMLTVPVIDEKGLDVAVRFAELADWLLLDSSHPTTGVVGATGVVHDWALSRRIVERVDCPVLLAGGLGPENVAEAIRVVRPDGVDSETRTSRVGDRRRKDLAKVEAFLEAASGPTIP
jgi:phosphoribosylanthranilate isomerase